MPFQIIQHVNKLRIGLEQIIVDEVFDKQHDDLNIRRMFKETEHSIKIITVRKSVK